MLQIGTSLQGRFVIDKVLGHGGMGVVYLARQSALADKRVAIKELLFSVPDPEIRARASRQFEREAHLLASLDHPNLVDVTDFFACGDNCYLVMNYVEGRTLQATIEDASSFLPIEQILTWLDEICDVLQYLHECKPPVFYRDLKPSNIMIDTRGHVKLLDFGIAKSGDDRTETCTFIKGAGTPGYAPVEQFGQEGSTDGRADIYSLGATVYTMVTRNVPPNAVDLMLGEATLPLPRHVNPIIPARFESLVLKMMALRREDRYQSVREVRDELAAVSTTQDVRAPVTRRANPVERLKSQEPLRIKRVDTLEQKKATSAAERTAPPGAPHPAPPPRSHPSSVEPPLLAAVGEADSVPKWATHLQTRNLEDDEEAAWRQRYRQHWNLKAILLGLTIALALPLLLNPRALGPLVVLNSVFYTLGSLVLVASGHGPSANVLSTLVQAAVPLLLALWLASRGERFGALLATFWFCEVLVEASLNLTSPPMSGPGRRWLQTWQMLELQTRPAQVAPMMHMTGLVGLAASLLAGIGWLVRTRPGRMPAPLPKFRRKPGLR